MTRFRPRCLALALFAGALLLAGCVPSPPRGAVLPAASADPAPSPGFTLADVAEPVGVRFRHDHGTRVPLTIVETMGSGCAFFDYNGDGRPDVFLVNSGQDFEKPAQRPASRLFRNDGPTGFTDVTEAAGIRVDGYAMGCCVGDYDNDGRPDLFVTGFGHNFLLHNQGGPEGAPTFRDVTKESGILQRPGAWGTGCAFVDVNRDGYLDLYVANYVRYDPRIPYCHSARVMSGCTPNQYPTQANELYVSEGRPGGARRFREQAVALGADDPAGAGLGVVLSDFDNDGWPDIFVANDGTPNALLHNEHGHFTNVGQVAGVAYAEDGTRRAGMGTDAADYDGDGLTDLVITNFQHEPNSLYRNSGSLSFRETTYPSGIGRPSLLKLAFGAEFADFDGDGRLDLYVGNGHVFDNVAQFDDTATYEQKDQVYRNRDGSHFDDVSAGAGPAFSVASVTRGLATGDFDSDGAPDVLINASGRPARLLRTTRSRPAHWLGLRLRGTRGNRDAIGARVELRSPLGLQVREVRSGGSYISQPDFRPLFGLGDVADPAKVELRIRWPLGQVQTLRPAALDRYLVVEEPGG